MGKKLSGLYVAEVKKQYKDRTYSSFLLRRSYREDGKVKQETIANLSSLPRDVVFILRDILRGNAYAPQEQALECVATRSHGHVAAIAAMADQLRLSALLDPEPCPERDLVYALVVARVARPLTKLATTRWWQTTTLMDNPVVAAASPEDVYKALDWLIERQGHIERVLARRHLHEGGMVLYDLSSSYVEGTHCTLAAFGHNRDRKQGKRQINYGLLTDAEGRPVAIEVFPGNTADPKTVDVQLQKIKDHFQLGRVVLVGDRGMLTSARIEVLRERGGIDWLSALRSKEIQSLAAQGLIPRSIFDERDLAEIHSPEFPGERLVVCRNPLLAEERVKHREALMAATEKMLERLSLRVQQGRLKRPEKIAEALGRIKNHYKVAKHFECVIGEGEFRYQRRQDSIQREAALDGIYVVRTSVPDQEMNTDDVVLSYKRLSRVERAFRTMKSVELRIRPVHHWTEDRVRAHFLLCMLAYYVEWHLRQAWHPFLFDDEYPGAHLGDSPVSPAVRSPQARAKSLTKQTADGWPVHSFATLLSNLGTIAANTMRVPNRPEAPTFTVITTPTPFQAEVLKLVGADVLRSRRQNKLA